MSDLERRMRLIMDREKISYQKMSDYADVSVQAVHKWLSTGSMSDATARKLAHRIGLDWLWLKHGVSRIAPEALFDIIQLSTANVILTRWDTFELLAVGNNLVNHFEYSPEDVIGRSVMELTPNVKEKDVRLVQRLIYALSSMVEYSYHVTMQDKYSVRALRIRGKMHTTDSQGIPYAVEGLEFITPNGSENKLQSFKLHKKAPLPIDAEDIQYLSKQYPHWPWLESFLRD